MTDKKTSDFIKKATAVHGHTYDYSKVVYRKATEKVCIICPIHGEFWQTPHNHLSCHAGCPHCCKNHNRYTTVTIVNAFIQKHGDKYDYSKVKYVNNYTKVCIICPIHGEFWQTPTKHLLGRGCPVCGKESCKEKLKMGKTNFIERANKTHGEKYNYSKVEYINANKKVCIICPKHGEFWQTPHHHLNGHGCPICNFSSLERIIANELKENHIEYIAQYNDTWLGRQRLDFYLPDRDIAIECQGEQHFHEVYYRSKKWTQEKREKNFVNILNRDKLKKDKCEKHGTKLLYFSDLSIDFPYQVYSDINALFDVIKNTKETCLKETKVHTV